MARFSILTAALLIAATPAIASDAPIYDISGEWTGTGFVQKNADSKPMKVKCQIEGSQGTDQLGFAGKCRAMVVLSRNIGANLVVKDGEFTGTYTGADVGVAQLHGAQTTGDQLNLEMTFPKEVNGDDKAKMVIKTEGENRFKITTVDLMDDGKPLTTASIDFKRDPQTKTAQAD